MNYQSTDFPYPTLLPLIISGAKYSGVPWEKN